MKLVYIILCTVTNINAASKAEEAEKIREQIIHDLGLSQIPDIHKVRIVHVYLSRSVRLTQENALNNSSCGTKELFEMQS